MAYSASPYDSFENLWRYTLTGEYETKYVACPPENTNCIRKQPDLNRPKATWEIGALYLKEGFILSHPIKEISFRIAVDPEDPYSKVEADLATLNAINGKFIIPLHIWLMPGAGDRHVKFSRSAETYTIDGLSWVIVSVKGSGGGTGGDSSGGTGVGTGGVIVKGKPTVSISADQANAAEAGSTNGRFLIKFDAPRSKKITVSYAISGTAKNGKDYTKIKSKVTIPAGQSSATVDIAPVDDLKKEKTEKVTLKVKKAGAYKLSTSKSATVEIADND